MRLAQNTRASGATRVEYTNVIKYKKNRWLKVYGQSNGYNYKDVPAIVLKGKWLEAAGFDIETDLMVECEDGKLINNAVIKEGL